MKLENINRDQLLAVQDEVKAAYQELKDRNLNLDLTRGKPSTEQLDFSTDLLSLPGESYRTPAGTDTRNYGGLTGITELRELWADVLGIPADNVFAGDASSLNIMFDLISWSYTFGNNDSPKPWAVEVDLKWICPVPGYDRHFTLAESLGGVESLIDHPATMTHLSVAGSEVSVSGRFIRLSVGIEDIDDILADLAQALDATAEGSAEAPSDLDSSRIADPDASVIGVSVLA